MSLETLDVGVCSSHGATSANFKKIVKDIELPKDKYTIEFYSFGNSPHKDFDTIIAILEEGDVISDYVENVTTMKLVSYVPNVIAIVPQSYLERIKKILGKLPADMVITSPINSKELDSSLHTLMAVHDIESRKSQRFKNRKPLGSILVENKLITSSQLSNALEYSELEHVKIGKALVELGLIPMDKMIWFLAAQMQVPFAGAKEFGALNRVAAEKVKESFASSNLCIPFKEEEDGLHVIMADPKDLQLLDRLRDITDLNIVSYLGKKADIITAIAQVYRRISTDAETTLLFEKSSHIDFGPTEFEEQMDDDESDEGIIRLVKLILTNASKDRASDIHIEPRENEFVIRYRVDGELRRVMSPPLNSSRPLLVRLKIMASLDIAERRQPQDGRFVIKVSETHQIDARLSILPTIFGEKAVIRLLDSTTYERNLSELGFSNEENNILDTQIRKPYGLVIITGPTGSGKTTTLYATLKELASDALNIVSVEDPVEYTMPDVSQVQVNTSQGLTFGKALRSILRQDPDVVMIGEIRDAETADIAVKMALTGHLVFATLHTNDAPSAVTRLVDIGIPPLLLSSSLNLVIAQRLVKQICPECKVETHVSDAVLKHLPEESRDTKLYTGGGCVQCSSTGFSGRLGLYEVLEITPKIRELILDESGEIEIRKEGKRTGMTPIFDAGLRRVAKGETTLEQVMIYK